MGFRFQKRIRIMPGVRLNISKSGLSSSFGIPGARINLGHGRRTSSFGVPGTGLSYRSQHSTRYKPRAKTKKSANSDSASPNADTELSEARESSVKPGLFASKSERAFFEAGSKSNVDALVAISARFPELAYSTNAIAGLLLLESDKAKARLLLQLAFDSGIEPTAGPIPEKYLNKGWSIECEIATGVEITEAISRSIVGLCLAEILQLAGEIDKAIDIVEQLAPTQATTLSLAEMYLQTKRYDDVLEVTNGITNEDDLTALLCIFRGEALREQGHFDAALVMLREAVKAKSRNAEVRHRGYIARSACYLASGKRGLAKRDLERVLAEDSKYPGLAEALVNFSGDTSMEIAVEPTP